MNHLLKLRQDLPGLVQVVVENHNHDDTQLVLQLRRVRCAVVVHLIVHTIERNHVAHLVSTWLMLNDAQHSFHLMASFHKSYES